MAENSNHIPRDGELKVPMSDVVRFVRQLSHDLRNNLNAAELQSAYLNEVVPDAEVKDEVKRLRGMLSEMGGNLQRLTGSLAQVKLTEMPYEAAAFMEDLQKKIASQFPDERAIEWKFDHENANLNIDPQTLQQAFVELFANALQHGRDHRPIVVNAGRDGNEFVFNLHEPKAMFDGATDNWGREPFHKVGHGHYGLGLHRARTIIEAHGGRLNVRYDSPSSDLVTTVALPIAPSQ
jgi:signal transduction histidine kinase